MAEVKKPIDEKEAKFQELAAFIASKKADPHELIAVLHKAQALFGYLPEEVQRFVAVKLDILLHDEEERQVRDPRLLRHRLLC